MINNSSGGVKLQWPLFRIAVFTLFMSAAVGVVNAQAPPTMAKPDGVAEKISPLLIDQSGLIKTKAMRTTQSAKASSQPANALVKMNDAGEVQVYVHVSNCSAALMNDLQASGLRVEVVNQELQTIQGWLPQSAIASVAANAAVTEVTPPSYRKARAESISDGDALIHANVVRATGNRGQGVRIGLLGDGVDNLAAAQAAGYLPCTITIDPAHKGAGDTGTSLLEIVYEVAPDASLSFSGPATSLEFISALNYLVNTVKCDVIFDDLGFYDEPYFEDGPVAQAVANIVNNVVYISSAGNDGVLHYMGVYNDVSTTSTAWPYSLHAFSGKDVSMQLVIPPQTTIAVFLEWSDKWGQASDDYDLYLYNADLSDNIAASTTRQNGHNNPYEALTYWNATNRPLTVNVLINKYSGIAQTLDLFVWNATSMQFSMSDHAIFGQVAVPGVLSVGAVNAATPNQIAQYSSCGPSLIMFPSKVVRQTPGVVAPDGVLINACDSTSQIFYGTSASAAYTAGTAALVKKAFGNKTPAEIIALIENTATNLGPAGYDNTFGWGLINAEKAAISDAAEFWEAYR